MRVNKRFLWIMAIFLASGVLMVSVGLYYQSKFGSAAGTIVDAATGAPLDGVHVEMKAIFDGTKPWDVKAREDTGVDGLFHLKGTVGGEYTLTATREGYRDLVVEGLRVASDQHNELGTFEMERESEDDS